MHLAAEKNFLSTIKKLLGYGADFTKGDLDGRNVIHYAAKDSVPILLVRFFLQKFSFSFY